MKILRTPEEARDHARRVEHEAETASDELTAALRGLMWLTAGVKPGEPRLIDTELNGYELHGLIAVLHRTAEVANRRYL